MMSDAPTSTLKQAEHPSALGIDPVVVLHKGVVLGSLAGYERVIHGWSPTERRAIAVKCDAEGDAAPAPRSATVRFFNMNGDVLQDVAEPALLCGTPW